MQTVKHGRIDLFILVATLLIVSSATFPFSAIDSGINFGFTHVISKVAEPFFLMVTGYFSPYLINRRGRDMKPLMFFLKRIGLIYLGALLVYLPISLYEGHYSLSGAPLTLLKNILFDGTFTHLWYYPACILGVLLIYALCRKLSVPAVLCITIGLYIFGTGGDNYYHIVSETPVLKSSYDACLDVFSFTRNGIFYAPVFIIMGAMAAKKQNPMPSWKSFTCFCGSMAVMLTEGFLLRGAGYQRYGSMFFALIPCMYFLFQFIVSLRDKPEPHLRSISMWVYLSHRLFLLVLIGAQSIASPVTHLLSNTIVRFTAVCVLSIALSFLIFKIMQKRHKRLHWRRH